MNSQVVGTSKDFHHIVHEQSHESTINAVTPAKKLGDNIISHSISPREFAEVLLKYQDTSKPVTKLVTKYYNQDLVLEVSEDEMKCSKTFINYSHYDKDLSLVFSRKKSVPISVSKFEVVQKLHHRRQGLVTTFRTPQYDIEFEILYRSVKRVRPGAQIICDPDDPDVLSRTYSLIFKGKPSIDLVTSEIAKLALVKS
jgi:hypothetical protein